MAIFICPNCEQRSEIQNGNDQNIVKHVCPHCGQEFQVDRDENIIVETE